MGAGAGNHNYNTTKSSKRRPQLKHIEEYKPNLGMSGITSKLSGSEIVEPAQPGSSASIPAANPSVLALGP